MAEEAEGTGGTLARVKEADAAGGDVARVGVGGLAIPRLCLVETDEVGVGHVNLATDLDPWWRGGEVEAQGEIADRPCVVSDVVADAAVAASCCQRQAPVIVSQRHGDAVDLQLKNPGDRPRIAGRSEEGLDLSRPGDEVVGGVGVVDRQHRDRMPHRGKAIEGLPSDPLGRAVGGDEIGMELLEIAELVDEPVVLEIGDLRCRLDVVTPVVVADQRAESRDALRGCGAHGAASWASSLSSPSAKLLVGGGGSRSRSSRSRRRMASCPISS